MVIYSVSTRDNLHFDTSQHAFYLITSVSDLLLSNRLKCVLDRPYSAISAERQLSTNCVDASTVNITQRDRVFRDFRDHLIRHVSNIMIGLKTKFLNRK